MAVRELVHKVIEKQTRRFMAVAAYHVKQRGTFLGTVMPGSQIRSGRQTFDLWWLKSQRPKQPSEVLKRFC